MLTGCLVYFIYDLKIKKCLKTPSGNQKPKRYSQRQKGTAKDKKVQPKTKRYSQRQRKTMVYKTSYRNFLIRIIEHSW